MTRHNQPPVWTKLDHPHRGTGGSDLHQPLSRPQLHDLDPALDAGDGRDGLPVPLPAKLEVVRLLERAAVKSRSSPMTAFQSVVLAFVERRSTIHLGWGS